MKNNDPMPLEKTLSPHRRHLRFFHDGKNPNRIRLRQRWKERIIRAGHEHAIFTCGCRPMKVRDVIKNLQDDGWYLARTRGSHRQYKHPWKSGLVTVAGHLSDELAPAR